jgi:hypothetical protein
MQLRRNLKKYCATKEKNTVTFANMNLGLIEVDQEEKIILANNNSFCQNEWLRLEGFNRQQSF